MLNTFFRAISNYYRYAIAFLSVCLMNKANADDNPFPSINVGGGDIVQTTGSHMETAFKYTLIGGGGLLILICLAVIIHRLRDDSREKDHGNLIMTFILVALGLTLGFILIGIGWTAFNTQIQS